MMPTYAGAEPYIGPSDIRLKSFQSDIITDIGLTFTYSNIRYLKNFICEGISQTNSATLLAKILDSPCGKGTCYYSEYGISA